jgi:signal transduction histidine kinase
MSSNPPQERQRRIVSIVDCNAEDRVTYGRYLLEDKEYEYTIIEATLGQAGLDLWQHHQPDVVLLEYLLPDLTGLEFLARLQAQTQRISVPVMLMTRSGSEEIAVRAMKAGVQDYLVKDRFDAQMLRAAVNTTIATAQIRTQLQQELFDRQHAEKTLRQSGLLLQAHVSELTNNNIFLSQAALLLDRRNQELDRFIHIVSHDLRAPLRSISNLSEWIETDLGNSLPPENQAQLQLLRSRVKRMEKTIDSLLEYVRVGQKNIKLETVNVAELLAEIIDSLDPPSTFRIEISPQMPTLITKRLLLNQVFTNLIGNAIDHSHRLDGQIEISVSEYQKSYKFAVRDNGPGIAIENYEKIFIIFQTLADRDRQKNTGIGLSIVKKIIEAEGGRIWLESRVGEGTTFFFTWSMD